MFLIDEHGGIGKTYLSRALLAAIRSNRSIDLATASLGVVADILLGGRTAQGLKSLLK